MWSVFLFFFFLNVSDAVATFVKEISSQRNAALKLWQRERNHLLPLQVAVMQIAIMQIAIELCISGREEENIYEKHVNPSWL